MEEQYVRLEDEAVVRKLFHRKLTVNQIAIKTGYDARTILLFLTSQNLYSEFCSTCPVKKCYECPGLRELGKPADREQTKQLLNDLTEPL